MSYSVEAVRQAISLDNIYSLLEYFHADPRETNSGFVCKTICHNGIGEGHHKLYFMGDNGTGIFHCFSGCEPDTFDIIDLIRKVQGIDNLNETVNWLVSFFSLDNILSKVDTTTLSNDFKIFKEWDEISNYRQPSREYIELPQYDIHFLKHYPWAKPEMLDEYITEDIIMHMGIKYDPLNFNVLIPHLDRNNKIIGVRQRTLSESQERFGKYKPWRHNNIEYNHPLSFNLYTNKYFWYNIQKTRTAIIFESEKSVLQYQSYFGFNKNCACAMCGSSLSDYQFNLLLENGVENIIIGVDRDYKDYNYDVENFNRYVNKIKRYWNKYNSRCNLSFLIDRHNLLGYKDSPTDQGKETFLIILGERRILTEKDFNV